MTAMKVVPGQYRKKPVVVRAEQFSGGQPDGVCYCREGAHIHTLEGEMNVSNGDWIITGVKGERYPCKPDIFNLTYEPALSAVEPAPDGLVEQTLALVVGVRERIKRSPGLSSEPFSDKGWAVIEAAMRSALTSRAAVLEEKNDWMPIETAPRNHMPILVHGEYGALVAFLDITWEWWPCPAHAPLKYRPTHWQPLPTSPVAGEVKG